MSCREEYPHYYKDVGHLDHIDVYDVLRLFEVTDHCVAHAVKKLLCPGVRGSKGANKDINEAVKSLQRKLEMDVLYDQQIDIPFKKAVADPEWF